MPKGQSPTMLMRARYSALEAKLKKTPKDYSTMTKLYRLGRRMLGMTTANVTTRERRDLELQVEKMGRQLSSQARRNPDREEKKP